MASDGLSIPLIATAAPVSLSMSTKEGSIRRPCVSQSAADPVEARARRAVQRMEERPRAKGQAFLRFGAEQRLMAVGRAMPNREYRLEVRRQRHSVEAIPAATLGAHHFPGDLAEHSR